MIKYKEIYKVDSTGKVRVYFIEQEDEKYRMVTGVLNGKLTRSKWTTAKPKNVGRANATTAKEQAIAEIAARYTKKLNEGYYVDLEMAKANPEGKFFQPMLAMVWEKVKEKDKQFPLIADPKLDGMRMTKTADEHISRKGKVIPTVPHIVEALKEFHEKYPTMRLDGEIYNHEYKENFNELMSIARKLKPTKEDLEISKKKLQYHVYDIYDSENPGWTAASRKIWLEQHLEETDIIKLVDYRFVHDEQELEEVKREHIIDGYEGTIIREPSAPYENKRSKYLLKIKEFITEEYEIIDILPGKGNKSDIAGRILVDNNGTTVGCGIRGSWEYCKTILENKDQYVGKDATIRHFGITPDKSLRFPVCIDIARPD